MPGGCCDAVARAAREKLTRRYDDGTVVITARLAPERGQRVLTAIEHLQHLAAEQDRAPAPAGPAEASAGDSPTGHRHDHGRDRGRDLGGDLGGEDEEPVRPGCALFQALYECSMVQAVGREKEEGWASSLDYDTASQLSTSWDGTMAENLRHDCADAFED
jgi:hypothetical protein